MHPASRDPEKEVTMKHRFFEITMGCQWLQRENETEVFIATIISSIGIADLGIN